MLTLVALNTWHKFKKGIVFQQPRMRRFLRPLKADACGASFASFSFTTDVVKLLLPQ
jgi:hypothetical protein